MNDLGIVYCHFNPIGIIKREKNLFQFQECLKRQIPKDTPVVSVEATFLNRHPISNPTIHLKANEMNCMWQKESLINIGMKELIKQGCSKIAWIDADLIFLDNNWFKKCQVLLDKVSVVQLFENVRMQNHPRRNSFFTQKGFVAGFYQYQPSEKRWDMGRTGLAWAARVDSIPHLLLDNSIIGGADKKMAFSWIGLNPKEKIETREESLEFSGETFHQLWLDWESKTPLHHDVCFLDSTITHLYHGEIKNRDYKERHRIIKHIRKEDFFKEESGLWRWSNDCKHMPTVIKKYFYSRKEDVSPYMFV